MPSESKILLTGATGFLGSYIRSVVAGHGTVLSLGRDSGNDFVCDLRSGPPSIKTRIDIVIHCAGKAHVVAKGKKVEIDFNKTNYEGTVNLLAALDQTPSVKKFVFISTVAVYGKEKGVMITEDCDLAGKTPYAKSKILAERALEKWAKNRDVKLSILRLPLIVGSNPPGNLGALVRYMKRKIYLGIGAGSAQKSVVLAEDVASFVPSIWDLGGTYNLTDGSHPAMCELEAAIAMQLGVSEPVRVPDALIRAAALVGDMFGPWAPINTDKYQKLTSTLTFSDEKARKEVGWNPRVVIENLPHLI